MAEGTDKPVPEQDEASRRAWTRRELAGKTVWDWLQLLIVPIMLSLITIAFTWQQDIRQQRIEDSRAERARKIEEQRAQQVTLQAYLDQMGTLLLSETELIQAGTQDRPPIISLKYASLRGFELQGKQLLENTNLTQAMLYGADLSEAHLEATDLSAAHLEDANLGGASLAGASLSGAFLRDADLGGADLSGADLSGADLTNAQVTRDQLQKSASLKGATLPDGSRYER